MSRVPSIQRWSPSRWVDSLGSVGATLCAIHCALLPFALALLPVLGLGILASSGFEMGFVLFATTLAVVSLWHGYRRHRAYHAMAFLVPGLIALWAGIFVPALHDSIIAHAVAMSIGGTLVAVAHLVNMRLSQGHVHAPRCAHSA
ncbi:MAG: MerC domain-containing protein [Arenimonas sp.]|jgi:hypothetical protein